MNEDEMTHIMGESRNFEKKMLQSKKMELHKMKG